MEQEIVNRVAASGLVTIDLEEYYPKEEILLFDLAPYLFKGLILKEKEFRQALTTTDWSQYQNKYIAVTCTTDAIIPMWAYMLVSTYLQPIAKDVLFANKEELTTLLMVKNINDINAEQYAGARIIVKGCGDIQIPQAAYLAITNKLMPFAKSIMYGEACSNIPVYKKKP
jgi:hypothetical protein